MSVEIINPDNHVYISYAWRDGVEQDVLDVCQVMNDNGIQYERDKDGLCPYKANLPKERHCEKSFYCSVGGCRDK